MGIDDREYMKERYRRRGGAVGIPIWRDRHARLEYDEADMVAGRYRAQAGSMLRLGPTSSATGSRKNMLAAAALGFAAIVYVLAAQPFGDVLDFSGLPKTGEFRVLAKLRAEPTGLLKIAAPDEDIALHLLDAHDREVFVGFVRKDEESALTVPAGRWHTIVTSGAAESLQVATDLTLGHPLGIIEISPGEAVTASRVAEDQQTESEQCQKPWKMRFRVR